MSGSPEGSRDTPILSDARLRWARILVTSAMFMEALDGSIINTALPAMAQSFRAEVLSLNIGVSAYLVALGVFMPASGWIADRYGTRRVFAAAILLFTLSSAACGAASDLPTFVAARIVQGMAGALMVPVGTLIVVRYTPRERLMAAMSALVWPALIAPVLGPPLGGFITLHFGWRWIFYLNLPLGVIGLICALAIIPNVRGEEQRPFDVVGFLLSGLGVFALLAGLEWFVATTTWHGLLLEVVGLILLALAVRHFRRTSAPLIDLSPLRITTFRFVIFGGTLFRMSITSAPFLLPLLFQVGFGLDPFNSGLLILALFAGNLTMKGVTTPVLKRFGYRKILIGNGTIAGLTLLACSFLQSGTPYLLIATILFIGGMSRSLQFTSLSTLVFSDVPKSQSSHANTMFMTINQISMALGVSAAAGSVHLMQWLAPALGNNGPDTAYRWAFATIAMITWLGLLDARRLPADVGDTYLNRSSGRE